MPKGKPNPQTVASEKFQKKAGYTVKGFKVKKTVSDSFAEACKQVGVSQAGKITELMQQFIEQVSREHPD